MCALHDMTLPSVVRRASSAEGEQLHVEDQGAVWRDYRWVAWPRESAPVRNRGVLRVQHVQTRVRAPRAP